MIAVIIITFSMVLFTKKLVNMWSNAVALVLVTVVGLFIIVMVLFWKI